MIGSPKARNIFAQADLGGFNNFSTSSAEADGPYTMENFSIMYTGRFSPEGSANSCWLGPQQRPKGPNSPTFLWTLTLETVGRLRRSFRRSARSPAAKLQSNPKRNHDRSKREPDLQFQPSVIGGFGKSGTAETGGSVRLIGLAK